VKYGLYWANMKTKLNLSDNFHHKPSISNFVRIHCVCPSLMYSMYGFYEQCIKINLNRTYYKSPTLYAIFERHMSQTKDIGANNQGFSPLPHFNGWQMRMKNSTPPSHKTHHCSNKLYYSPDTFLNEVFLFTIIPYVTIQK